MRMVFNAHLAHYTAHFAMDAICAKHNRPFITSSIGTLYRSRIVDTRNADDFLSRQHLGLVAAKPFIQESQVISAIECYRRGASALRYVLER